MILRFCLFFSGKRKRSSQDFNKLPLRKNIINSRALLNEIIQKQIPLDMTNSYSLYQKPANPWNGKQNNDRKTNKRIPAKFNSLENLYKVLRNMNKYETPTYIKSRTYEEIPKLSTLFDI